MKSRLPFVFILMTLLIDAMGIGLILPVMPSLIGEVSGGNLADAALWGGVLTTSFAVMQFVCGPTIGGLSDRFGRRPVLLISMGVMALDYLVMALAGSIWLLLAGRIVGGITAATHSTAAAYIADISAPEKKSANFGLIGAAFGVGFILGPVMGGLLAEFGTRAPFYAAAALACANLTLGWLVLPETVTDRIRRPFRLSRANPFGALRAIGHLPALHAPMAVFALYEFAQVVYPATWAYFGTARFGWSPGMIGLNLAIFGISFAIMQGGLIRVILPWLGEWRTIAFGLTANILIFLMLAFIENGTWALILTPLTALGACVQPPLQGIMSRATPDNQQGELQGLLQSLRSLAMIAGPLAFTTIFFAATAPGSGIYMPGAVFLLSAGLMVVCGLILVASSQARARPAA
ncbi:MAG: TCR/Tet family MFS transporter [Gemmobacter sp.]|nr:TCR/Tet family MFS transporter [Gemmobacter sp.]